jgi:hypothetical protein
MPLSGCGTARHVAAPLRCWTSSRPVALPRFSTSIASQFFTSQADKSSAEPAVSISGLSGSTNDGDKGVDALPGERLSLFSGSAVHERAKFGGRDVALTADSYGALGVFDSVGGWHSLGGNEFARSLERQVRRSLATMEAIKQGECSADSFHFIPRVH